MQNNKEVILLEIYFSPELMSDKNQILNIVNDKQEAVGLLSFILEEKKIYIFGNLEEIGVREDFKDLIKPYIHGLTKSKPDLDVFSYITTGGEMLDLNKDKQEE